MKKKVGKMAAAKPRARFTRGQQFAPPKNPIRAIQDVTGAIFPAGKSGNSTVNRAMSPESRNALKNALKR